MSQLLTDEQLDQIGQVFNIQRRATLRVRDGFVHQDDVVWWRCENGPQKVAVKTHLANLKEFPEAYQLSEPKTKIVYLEEGI